MGYQTGSELVWGCNMDLTNGSIVYKLLCQAVRCG